MVGTYVVVGGTFYLGYRAYSYLEHAPRPVWWQALTARLHRLHEQVMSKATPTPAVEHKQLTEPDPHVTVSHPLLNRATNFALPPQLDQAPKQRLILAAASLGLATTGTLYSPPLRIAALPVLIYLGIAPAYTAQQTLRQEGRVTAALAETVVMAFCVVQGYYLVGSLGCVIYYLGQIAAEEKRKQARHHLLWQPPTWAWRQDSAGETVTLVCCLQPGDRIAVHPGEMVPVAGVVASGLAWVRPQNHPTLSADEEAPLGIKVSAGDAVAAATIVLVGHISVVVDPIN